ncbi:MAG TPA: GH92 family glycosyl hydrolase [Pseudonocardiaceae bacterium]|jgi:predicted alpha-1,2-mannosidase|nr:GH92 family glycosyl hydrolase [Pseudonocardiaceae bacterium]
MRRGQRGRRGLLRGGGAFVTALALMIGTAAVATAAPRAAPRAATAAGDVAQYVDTFLGTQPGAADQGTGGGAGNDFPGADVPFGMVQWSPDTVTMQPGGYFYQDNRVRGFSLTHLSGAGCFTYEDIPFLPFAGQVTDSPATDPNRYVGTFSHANEQASPGYYGVTLDSGVQTELTTTQRTGYGRFTYPAGDPATLLVNTSGSISGTSDSQVTIGKNTISGWASSGDFCGASDHYRIYFYAQFDQNFAATGTWHNGAVTPSGTTQRGGAPASPAVMRAAKAAASTASPKTGEAPHVVTPRSGKPADVTASGPGTGGYVTFDTTRKQAVNVRVGVSFVSIAGAQGNLTAENDGKQTFDQVAAAARATWNSRLGEVAVTGGTDAEKQTFYSNLYHAVLQPNVFSDSDGSYTGFDGQAHKAAKGHAIYTNFSGWDIYRSESQLLALLAPAEMSDIVTSMVDFAEQGGAWDRWTVANDFTGVMNGDPYHIIVSNAYAFGAKDFDARTAELLMVKGATQVTTPATGYVERPGLADYEKLGYVPGAAADTLEYTSADFAIAQLAQRLGDTSTFDTFMQRAQDWQNLYNPATGYLQPRNANGSFNGSFDPASASGYVEGNGAQYTWMVPYDEGGLVTALGGNAAVNQRLDTFFSNLNAGTSQPFAFLSNEPSLETPYLYDFTGAPYKTQAITRTVDSQLFNAGPAGLEGNDDLGEMASFYVWSAIGLYPEIPGRAELTVGSPLFSQVKIVTPDGRQFTVNAPGASDTAKYVTGMRVDGTTTTKPWLPESFAQRGGTLDFAMSATPDTTWGAAAADAPPSFRDGEQPALPFVDPNRLVIGQGGTDTATIGAQDLSGTGLTANWTATPPTGITLSADSGTVTVAGGQKSGSSVTVSVGSGAPDGTYHIPVSVTGPDGALPASSLTVLVAQPGSIQAAFDTTATSPDDDTSVADFDGDGFAYSADAIAAAGVTPGSTITEDGIPQTWPDTAVGDPNSVTAHGQTIDVPGASATDTKLALLGTATNGDTSGTLTVTYTDGSTQTATIGFSDWTLGAGGEPVAFANRTAITTPYRNQTSGGNQSVSTFVFTTAPITLAAGKTVRSVTLPDTTSGGGTIHVFSVGVA